MFEFQPYHFVWKKNLGHRTMAQLVPKSILNIYNCMNVDFRMSWMVVEEVYNVILCMFWKNKIIIFFCSYKPKNLVLSWRKKKTTLRNLASFFLMKLRFYTEKKIILKTDGTFVSYWSHEVCYKKDIKETCGTCYQVPSITRASLLCKSCIAKPSYKCLKWEDTKSHQRETSTIYWTGYIG